jgi:methylglutaconyl-CoA hydratase
MSAILVEHQGPIGIVTLNRPEKHNAFDDTLIGELTATLKSMDSDTAIRVLVLSSAGKSFSAGADLAWMKRMAACSETDNFRDAMALGELMHTLHSLSKPTVARVQGAAYGGGVGLIACCDMAIGAYDATFALSEVRLGLIPAVIGPYVIAAIGKRQAQRYFLSGERFDAAAAYRIGLLHEIAKDEEELDERIGNLVESLLLSAPDAQREGKSLIDAVAFRPITSDMIEDTAHRIARLRVSREGQEGLSAFLEKRDPGWIPPRAE